MSEQELTDRQIAAAEATIELASIQKKNTLVDNVASITSFSGDTQIITLADFFEQIDYFSDLFKWGDEEKKFILMTRTSGPAAKIVKNHKHSTLKEIKDILKERYSVVESPELALSRLMSFRQSPGMSVRDFFDRAQILASRALKIDGVDEGVATSSRQAVLHSMLLSNLLPEIRRGVITKDPRTPEQILQLALLEEKGYKSINSSLTYESAQPSPVHTANNVACATNFPPRVSEIVRNTEIEALKEKLDILTAKVESLVVEKSTQREHRQNSNSRSQVICFACGERNHTVRVCPYYGNQANNNRGRQFSRGRANFRGNFNDFYNGRGNFSNNMGYYGFQGPFPQHNTVQNNTQARHFGNVNGGNQVNNSTQQNALN